jgi:autotransporter-associated beta strand protein
MWAVQYASAGTEHWIGNPGVTATTNWNDAANWTGIAPPQTFFNQVQFWNIGAVGAPGVINNVLDSTSGVAQMPIWELDYISTNANVTTFIPPGVTMSTGAGNGKLYVGCDQVTAGGVANAVETITITGAGGTLNVGGNLRVGQGFAGAATSLHNVILDLSGLDTFLMSPASGITGTRFLVCGQSRNRAQGTVYLAKTNIVVVQNDVEIGAMSTQSNTVPVGVYLGQTNALYTGLGGVGSDTFTVGSRSCTNGFMKFNPAFLGGANPPAYAYFGSPSSVNGGRINIFYVAFASSGLAGIQDFGYCDFSGGYVNLMATTMHLGYGSSANMNATGTLTFDNGIVDANVMNVGNQTVSAGGTGVGIVNIGANATLKVNNTLTLAATTGTLTSGTAGTINVNGGTLIAPSITSGAGVSTLNLTNATLQLFATPGSTTTYSATVTNLNIGGTTNTIVLTFTAPPTNYPFVGRLIKYASFSGTLANVGVVLPVNGTAYVGYVSNYVAGSEIDLVITGGPAAARSLTWSGTLPGDWDVGSTMDWLDASSNPTAYNQLDLVQFDDTATGTTTVNLTTMLTPGALTITNASKTYTFSGSGSLGGAAATAGGIPGGLVKQGTGTLILANTTPDSYLGGVTVSGGVLEVGDGVTAGSGSLGSASGAVANSGGLVVNRPSGDTLTVGNIISGAGGITNVGAGTLLLNGGNTFTGPVAVNAGTVQLGSNTGLGTIAGGTFVASGATLDLNGKDPGYEPITVSGTGVGGGGAIINNTAGNSHLGAVTLAGDVLFAGSQRWDLTNAMVASTPHNVTIASSLAGYSTEWRDLNASTAVNNLTVASGVLGWVGNTTAGTSGTLEIAGGAGIKLYNDGTLTANLAKPLVLDDGSSVLNGAGANTISGPIALNGFDTFDIQGTSLTLSGPLSGTGTVYKQTDPAPLFITGNSPSFNGAVSLYAGKIYFSGILGTGASSSITSQSGTILAGKGTNNGPVDVFGGLTPGDGGVLGTNTFGSLTLESSALMTNDLATSASGASDLIVVNGNLTLNNSTIYLNPIGGTLEGNRPYTLITYSGTFGGSLPAVQTAASSVYTIILSNATSLSPKRIQAIVTGGTPDLLVWDNASGNAEWDVGSSGNWSNTVSHLGNDVFYGSDAVLFNDAITNSAFPVTALDIASGVLVAPSAITNNSTTNYTISGAGSISGGASIVKMGSSTLTLSNANTFTGPVTILGGTVKAATATALGATTGTVTITNAATLDVAYAQGAKPIMASGAGVGGNGAIVNNDNSTPLYDSSGGLATLLTLTGDTTFGGSNRWDLGSPSGATLSTGGKSNNVTVVGPGTYKEWQSLTIDPALANISILGTELGVKGMTNLGNPTNTVTIYAGGQLTFWGGSNYTKNYYVKSNGTLLVRLDGPVFNLNMTLEGGAVFHSMNNVKTMTAPVNLLGVAQFLSDNATCTFSNVISGTGGVAWTGNNNQFVFAAANTYQGQTIIGNGLTLALLGSGSMSSSSLIFFGGTDTNAFRIDVTGKSDQTLTLASGQTLEGAGRVNGALVVSPGATVSPGTNTTFGAIGAAGAVTLNGTATMKIYNPTANDAIQSSTSISYGGTLNLEFLTGTLAAGNSWKLFNAPGASYSGSFTVAPPSPGTGLSWDTSTLNTDGTLRVVSTVMPQPDLTGITIAGGNLTLSGTNGPHSGTYYVLTSTNVAQALNNWTRVSTNQFDANGNFTWTTNTLSSDPARFFRLQVQ